MGILESKREQIIGNDEMIVFGSIIKNMEPPKQIVGIKRGVQDKKNDIDVEESYGLIRRPSSPESSIGSKFMSVDGLIPNGALAIVHFVLILTVPIFFPIVFFLALCEMTTLQSDVYGQALTFFDFYSTNRLNPWW